MRGQDARFGSPALWLNGGASLTFATGSAFSDPGAVACGSPLAIAAGAYHSLTLKSDGMVVAWGYPSDGVTNVPAGLSNVVAIAGGGIFSLALQRDGTVVGWGDNSYGQLDIPVGLSNVVAIAGRGLGFSYAHSLALKGDGTVVAWGAGTTYTGSQPNYGQSIIPGGLSLIPFTLSGSVNINLPGNYPLTYTASNVLGSVRSATRTVVVADLGTLGAGGGGLAGDVNGDGIVSQSELDAVYGNYVTNSPWLYMTNVAGLGGTNVSFALDNSTSGAYTVQYSTNLVNWLPLGPAPRATSSPTPTRPPGRSGIIA